MQEKLNYCEICKVHYKGGYIAYTDHSGSPEHKAIMQIDSLIRHMNFAAERLAELRGVDKLRPFIPAFNSVDTCSKCNTWYESSLAKKPLKYYKPATNTMTRTCPCCGFSWTERCADGSEPNWEKIE